MFASRTTEQLPTADRPHDRPHTHEMVVVHRVFRRESALLPRLVRAVADGDHARVPVVAGHVREYMAGLHHHHELEDELLWPLLRARCVQDDALVTRMELQHLRIDGSLTGVTQWLPEWERTTDSIAGEELALALDAHRIALVEHLDEEEQSVLPLVAEHLTVAEWDLLGARGMEAIPDNRRLLALGAILEDATPEERAFFLGRAPLLGRLLWRTVGRRQYAALCRTLRGPLGGE